MKIEKLADVKMTAEAAEPTSKRPFLIPLPLCQFDEYKHLARGASARMQNHKYSSLADTVECNYVLVALYPVVAAVALVAVKGCMKGVMPFGVRSKANSK